MSGLSEVVESAQTVAAAAAESKIHFRPLELHLRDGRTISSPVILIRDNPQKHGELIVELAATQTSKIILYVPRDPEETVYAKVWPRRVS